MVFVSGAAVVSAGDTVFQDHFDTKQLKKEWEWSSKDSSVAGVVEPAKKRFVVTGQGNHDHWNFVPNAPYLAMDCPQAENWDFEAALEVLAKNAGEQGALIVMFSEKDCFYFGPYGKSQITVERSREKFPEEHWQLAARGRQGLAENREVGE